MQRSTDTVFAPLWKGFSYKEHQEVAIEWMLERENNDLSGGLLCDEMGLGKTMEILGTINNSNKENTLLLCPKAVIPQWVEAASKSKMNVVTVGKAVWQQEGGFYKDRPFLYISNYEKLIHRTSLFHESTWDRVVLDEAHKVSNKDGKLYKCIKKLDRETTWAVTATPIVNGIDDMKGLFYLIGYKAKDISGYSPFLEAVTEACLHRSMEEMRKILPELPPKELEFKPIRLDFESEEEGDFYRDAQSTIKKRLKKLNDPTSMLQILMRLRQLSVHPQVFISARKKEPWGFDHPDWTGSSSKFSHLRKMIEKNPSPGKWIIFCQFHEEMKLMEEYLSESESIGRVQQYHGGLSDNVKKEVIEATRESVEGNDILLLQLHSGGVGLNLQHFTKIVFMSPWWTSALMAQAVGRAVRIGQKERVEVYRLILKEEETLNIDEKMMEKAMMKKDLLIRVFKFASKGLGYNEPEEIEDNDEHSDVAEMAKEVDAQDVVVDVEEEPTN